VKAVFEKIKKRDGRIVEFDSSKITAAICKAGTATGEFGEKDAKKLMLRVLTLAHETCKDSAPEVEEIQDIVERVLLESPFLKTAKAYILYREQHAQIRNIATRANVDLVDQYLQKLDWKINENSNMCYSLQGLNNYISSDITSEYWLNRIYPPEIRNAHKNGELHIHDLSQLSVYCVGWDLKDLLLQGFRGVPGKVESAPPRHLRTALGQLVNFIYTLQGESAGAQAVSSFDTLLAPFVRYDRLNYKEVKQAVQEFVFNANIPTRVGFQTPFFNITMDLEVPSTFKDHPVIIGGKYQTETYSDFQPEMDIINEAFAEIMMEGDAAGRVFTFPIPTYNITKDFDWDNPNLNKLWVMTGKFGTPYFSNFVNSDMSPDDARSMCPLHPDTKVAVRAGRGMNIRTIKDLYYTSLTKGTRYEVLFNGKWLQAGLVADKTEGCLEFTLGNGQQVAMDIRHEQPVKKGKGENIQILRAGEIAVGMYVPFNATPVPDAYDNYDAGFVVGAFLGDGSYDGKGSLVYSLNAQEKEATVAQKLKAFYEKIGFKVSSSEERRSVIFHLVRGSNRAAESWMAQFIKGKTSHKKRLTQWTFQMGTKFLEGLLDGWYATDGGNRGRIYTVNKEVSEDFSAICGLIGKAYTISEDSDTREGRYGDNPVHTLKFHTRSSYGDFYFYEDGYWWFPVKQIRPMTEYSGMVFCFTVDSEEHLFQLANGLVTHNCRLRLDNRELIKRGGGLFGANPLTGSIGVVTVNLPRIGYVSKNEDEFFERLRTMILTAKDSLLIKRKVLETFTEKNLYPYSKFYLRDVKNATGMYWKNHFSTFGIIGMNEACINFMGKDIGTEEGQAFSLRVMDFIRELISDIQEETGELFNLEATPAEGTSYRLAMLDKEQFPAIVCANENEYRRGEDPYYTNSTQLPVNYTDNIFETLNLQDELQTKYTGGTVLHIFLGEMISDVEVVKSLVKKITAGFRLPYFTLTPTFSVCPSHGYLNGEQNTCPVCRSETEIYSRIVGYLRPVKQWNKGKQAEFIRRKPFKVN
jgi:ribonucleoside-triphosphate reductase